MFLADTCSNLARLIAWRSTRNEEMGTSRFSSFWNLSKNIEPQKYSNLQPNDAGTLALKVAAGRYSSSTRLCAALSINSSYYNFIASMMPLPSNHSSPLALCSCTDLRFASSRFLSMPFSISFCQSVPSQTAPYSPRPTMNNATT